LTASDESEALANPKSQITPNKLLLLHLFILFIKFILFEKSIGMAEKEKKQTFENIFTRRKLNLI